MTEIKPFPAVIYNYNNKVCQPHKVICPPYDIITSIEARVYRRLSCYNMIHLTLPKGAFGQNRYERAASCFDNYLKEGVFCQDNEPAIYFYQQEFKIGQMENFPKGKGTRFRRLGFIACLGLNSNSSIYGHEHTRIEPKEDRFKLLVNVQANLEPIFVLFSDPGGFLQDMFKKYILPNKPLISFRDKEKNMNTLWRLTTPAILKKIKMRMANKIIFIADGHHRYEVSLNYQRLMHKRLNQRFSTARQRGLCTYNRNNRAGFGDKDFNYIMAYFCPVQSPDLVVKPVHRLVKGIGNFPMDKFKNLFYIQKTTRRKLFTLVESKTSKQRMIGMYFKKNFYIFILKNNQILSKVDKDYRSLDVCLLNHLVLNRLLRVKPEDKQRIIFSANSQDLIRQADIDKASLVFFIKPVRISDIIYLAKAGKKMPTKTTYFYPKVPSGLVIYKFNK